MVENPFPGDSAKSAMDPCMDFIYAESSCRALRTASSSAVLKNSTLDWTDEEKLARLDTSAPQRSSMNGRRLVLQAFRIDLVCLIVFSLTIVSAWVPSLREPRVFLALAIMSLKDWIMLATIVLFAGRSASLIDGRLKRKEISGNMKKVRTKCIRVHRRKER